MQPTTYEIARCLIKRWELGDILLDDYLAARYDDVLLWAEENLSLYELRKIERLAQDLRAADMGREFVETVL